MGASAARSSLQADMTPLVVAHWESLLADHSDRDYVAYLLKGIERVLGLGLIGR